MTGDDPGPGDPGPGERVHGWTVEARLDRRASGQGAGGVLLWRARRPGEVPVVLEMSGAHARWRTRAALRRRALLLDRLAGDGVVRLLDVFDRRGTVLVVEHVAGGSLRRLRDRRRPGADVRRALADRVQSLAQRVADAGVPTGPVTAARVLLDRAGRPRLRGPTGAVGEERMGFDPEAWSPTGSIWEISP